MLSRRQALTAAANVVAGLAGGALAPRPAAASLKRAFAPKRIPYGACVSFEALQSEIDYRDALQTYCQQLTPEAGLFWGWLRPTAAQFRFDYADLVLAFAEANNMTMVGHTLVWYGAMPDWTKAIEGSADAERTMTEHIEKVVGRYRGKIKTWHVVNEPIDEANGNTPGLRPSVWLSNLGEKYIDMAFRIAHRVDPAAKLFINKYVLDSLAGKSPKKREAFRRLIHDLQYSDGAFHAGRSPGHAR